MRSAFLLLAVFVSVVAGAEGRAAPDLKKTAEAGGVAVSVTPLNLGESGSATIDFQVSLETHMGALPSNMLMIARLVGDKGAEEPASAWSGGKGGHHLSGRLSFPAGVSETGGTLTLILKSIGGGGDLRFEWKIPSKLTRS